MPGAITACPARKQKIERYAWDFGTEKPTICPF
jgi:hypothetical protein